MVDTLGNAINDYGLKKISVFHNHFKNLKMTWAYPGYVKKFKNFGTKIYVSATLHNSLDIFRIVAPCLLLNKVSFKVIANHSLLEKVNRNVFGYLHTGKFITIYPVNGAEFIEVTKSLNDMLSDYKSVPIPLKNRYKEDSIIYFDYNQFVAEKKSSLRKGKKLFLGNYILLNTIRQRARGGTYLALEILKNQTAGKKVIIKEARNFSEIELSGVDAVIRLHWQHEMLDLLNQYKITPKPYKIVKQKNASFLIMEYLPGKCLRETISRTNTFCPFSIKNIMMKTIEHIKKLHEKDIYFLELCPDNIMILPNGQVRLIDCDLCHAEGAPKFVGWNHGTPGFFPDFRKLKKTGLNESQWFCLRDIYALGSVCFSLFFPCWYKSLFEGTSAKENCQSRLVLINLLPEKLQTIFRRSLLLEEPFLEVSEFKNSMLDDINWKNLKLGGIANGIEIERIVHKGMAYANK